MLVGKKRFEKCMKQVYYYKIMHEWMKLLENNIDLDVYFKINNISTIALYEINDLAIHLIKQLEDSDVVIKYICDENYTSETYCVFKSDDLVNVNVDVKIICDLCGYQKYAHKRFAENYITIENIIYDLTERIK